MGAMYEEVAGLVSLMENVVPVSRGMRTYYQGRLHGVEVVVVFSRWGKVAAAATTVHLLLEFGITELLFTGLSGAISSGLRVGDIVIGERFYQHDMDATPLMARFEIPMLDLTYIESPPDRVTEAAQAIRSLLKGTGTVPGIDVAHVSLFGLQAPAVRVGSIASGDKFFTDESEKQAMREVLPDVLCVEMEGAAVAQVCYEYGIPFTIVRIISDTSDAQSETDFLLFTSQVASSFSVAIVEALLAEKNTAAA